MILRTVYVRFYRAFNFDYLRKNHPNAKPDPWDLMEDGAFYPYISLDIDPELTAVVGANESGKSQLLQAIECALGKIRPETVDFCRYSTYFTVAEAMRLPHFGLHFVKVLPAESDAIVKLANLKEDVTISSFRVFRTSLGAAEIYLGDGSRYEIDDLAAFNSLLPNVFRIEHKLPIPNSVRIGFLAQGGYEAGIDPGPTRTDQWAIVDPIMDKMPVLLSQRGNPEAFAATVQELCNSIAVPSGFSTRENDAYRKQQNLAFDLLVTVGGIHPSNFALLQTALRNDDQGLANGIVASMNNHLEKSLNLAKWWSQDTQFRLKIAVREFDVVFTIRDRTGSEYSFAERSDGLKFFLSYLVQFLTHIRSRSTSEILLMDEPDAYLSNQGQQDLLRLLQEFSLPTAAIPGGQVIYVTHSPFLIDKNRANRIRVLDKGSRDEGTRIVRDVGRNHFEPLRTALGGFVGESAFIGNCNLMLEGIADQIYLAGMSTLLNRKGVANTERLDLNRITLVPAGSASHVPYMTFLARGRDADKPAVIVLLDGDEAGDDAVKALKRGGPRNKELIRSKYIAQLKPNKIPGITSDRTGGPLDIEDLIPVEVGLDAARRYLIEMEMVVPENFPSEQTVRGLLSESTGVFKAITKALEQTDIELRIEKVGFARHAWASACDGANSEPVAKMCARFAALFSYLTGLQREAERERERGLISARVNRETSRFLDDQRTSPTKADVSSMLDRVEGVVDLSVEGHALLRGIREIRHDFELELNPHETIADVDALNRLIGDLKYAEVRSSQSEVWATPANGKH